MRMLTKAFSCALLALLLLTLPIHSQGQFCPGERVSSFSCTTVAVHAWSGSALDGQCPSNNPSDGISLNTAANSEGDTAACGIFNATVTSIMGGMLSSTMSFTASSDLDGTDIVCRNATPAEVESYRIMIVALGRVANVGRSGPDTIEWDRPPPAECTSDYIYSISVAGGPGGTITSSATSTMISLSAISGDLDTCDDNLRITVTAGVPSIGLVASSMSDPFDPTSAFVTVANDVTRDGLPTYAITNDRTRTVILITWRINPDSEVLELFPDTIISSVSYSGSQPSCGGSSEVVNNEAQLNISCLGDTNVAFTAELVDIPDCSSSTLLQQRQSFSLITEQPMIAVTTDSATVSFPMPDDVRVEGGSFDVVGTATRVTGGSAVESEPATYPDPAVFSNLVSNTSYSFVIDIVSNASDRIVIGTFSGNFRTSASSASSSSIGAIVGGVVGGIAALLVAVMIVVLVCLFCCRDKSKGEQHLGPVYEDISSHNSPRDIDIKDNVAYGPVTPQQPAAMYEQPERIEMSGNVAYGQISH